MCGGRYVSVSVVSTSTSRARRRSSGRKLEHHAPPQHHAPDALPSTYREREKTMSMEYIGNADALQARAQVPSDAGAAGGALTSGRDVNLGRPAWR